MSDCFKDRHQTIHVNHRGRYLEVKVNKELVDRTWSILTTCEVRFNRHCEKCERPGNGGLVLRSSSDRGLSYALQDLMNKVQDALRKKRLTFNDSDGFRVPQGPPVMCVDCDHWPRNRWGKPEYEWHPATCPGGEAMNVFDGQPYLRMEYDASDCEHFKDRKK